MRSRWNTRIAGFSWVAVGVMALAGCSGDRDETRFGDRTHADGNGAADGDQGAGDGSVEGPASGGGTGEGTASTVEMPTSPELDGEQNAMDRAAACPALREDRARANLQEVNRLGLEMSSVRLEGTLGEPVQGEYGLVAPLVVEKVWVGPTFLEGTRTFVSIDAAEREALELPGRYLLGFGTTVPGIGASSYPVREGAELTGLWEKGVVIPIEERDAFADLLEYRVGPDPLVAVVQVSTEQFGQTTLGVAWSLAGNIPSPITMSWDRSTYGVDFPRPDTGQYLATFGTVYTSGDGTHFADLLDFRPYDAEVLEMARRAIAAPLPERDVSGLLQAARAYRTSWLFHRAEAVLATRVAGIASECCTGKGGTFFSHEVVRDFRGGAGPERVVLGGHGYFSEEGCGDGFIHALRGLEAASVPESADSFACEDTPSIYFTGTLAQVDARRADSAEARDEVDAWVRSPEPAYLLRRPADGAGEPADVGPGAVWSQPMSVEDALVAGPLTLIRVASIAERESHVTIGIETGFSSTPGGPPLQQFDIDAQCSDPRLNGIGAEWLAPIVANDVAGALYDLRDPEAFLVPGVLLPNYGYIVRIGAKLRSAVGADELLTPYP